ALDHPSDTAVESDGTVLIADSGNDAIRQVAPDGKISTVAGSGAAGFAGDGGPAASARLRDPHDVAAASNGGYLISDTGNDRVRRVAPDGTISTVAGNGTSGFSGQGDPAAQSGLDRPSSVIALAHGGFLVADTGNNRV